MTYSMTEIADMLNVSKDTIRRALVRAGHEQYAAHEIVEPYCTEADIRDVVTHCRIMPQCDAASCRFCKYGACTILKYVTAACSFYKPSEVMA